MRWMTSGVLALAVGVAGCAPKYTRVKFQKQPGVDSKRGDTFGYRSWVSKEVEPDVVIIGIHGFCGASIDYENMGQHLLAHQPKTALYAYEVRGQGSDPIRERRGDIGDPHDWYRDLFAFTQLVKERHRGAKIVWYGESMGALIASHAYREAPENDPPCDALALSSPIVRFKDDIPAWQPALIQMAAATVPLARVSIEALAGGQNIQMTQTSTHLQQSETNSYNIEQHTMRLLGTLAKHIDTMNDCAARFRVPVLVLHGENDFFNTDSDMRGFVAHIPADVSTTYKNFPGAYHLLMYDAKKEKVFGEVESWTSKLRRNRL
jgi:alpha-beta hydrolase superfamily lysophospholipase